MKKIGIFTGGYSEEKVISEKSADYIQQHLSPETYRSYRIQVNKDQWTLEGGYFNRETARIHLGVEEIKIDAAFIIIHGPPAENGLLQAYFEMMNIPYTFSSPLSCEITFDKAFAKEVAGSIGVPIKPSILLRKGEQVSKPEETLGFPFFVKPNRHGSSFGISKVSNESQIQSAIDHAFEFDNEILLEAFADGVELSCGVLVHQGKIQVLPVTEIRPETEFFDFAAKYEHASNEITPAEIDPALQKQCQMHALALFKAYRCSGIARFDFILEKGQCYFIEANTIPGMSSTSIIPQQLAAAGIADQAFVEDQIEQILLANSSAD